MYNHIKSSMSCTSCSKTRHSNADDSAAKLALKVSRPASDSIAEFVPKPVFKVLVVGNSGVGKTQLLNRLVGEDFDALNVATIGVDFKYKTCRPRNAKPTLDGETVQVKFQLVDTAGQEKYRCITQSYYHGMHITMVCFRIGDEESEEAASYWTKEVQRQYPEGQRRVVLLVGTFTDHPGPTRFRGPFSEAPLNCLPYYEVSSKLGEITSLENFFQDWTDSWYKQYENSLSKPEH